MSGSSFIHFEGITFARDHIIAISGPTISDTESKPHFRICLTHGHEWLITGNTDAEMLALRTQLIQQL